MIFDLGKITEHTYDPETSNVLFILRKFNLFWYYINISTETSKAVISYYKRNKEDAS